MSNFSKPRVAIIGAGPAGSILALLLIQASVDVTIFEGETSANARSQGGTLDLHTDTGLAAMKKVGLYDEFVRKARYDGEAIQIANKKMKVFVQAGGTNAKRSRGRPEMDRKDLRDMLIAALPPHVINWGRRLRNIDDDLTLHFDGSTESGFDLIVGADGTWSKVRPLVTPIKPYYSGVTGIRLGINNAAETYPDLHALVNGGSLFTFGDHKSLLAQQLGDGSLTISTFRIRKEDWQKDVSYSIDDLTAVKASLLEEYNDWAPELKKLIEVSEVEPWAANMYMLPVGHRWTHRPGVTLLGDAAHVMTPFAGEGVNLAMEDAMHLADAIIATQQSAALDLKGRLAKDIRAYEENMFVRATKTQQLTLDLMTYTLFTDGALDNVIEKYILRIVGDNVPWLLMPLVTVAVYAYFWYWRLRYA